MQRSSEAQQRKGTGGSWIFALLACSLGIAGCAQQRSAAQCNLTDKPPAASEPKMLEVMQAAEDVLTDMHFVIEKADADTGLIRTKPLPGAQFFELWRKDTMGPFNSLEANLHSIRRIVELHVNNIPNENGTKVRARCYVKVQRLSLPEYAVARGSSPVTRKPEWFRATSHDTRATNMAWIDLGNDKKLATEILNRIGARLDARRSSGTGKPSSSNEI